MRKQPLTIIAAALVVIGTVSAVYSASDAGTMSDPLVSLSQVSDSYIGNIRSSASQAAESACQALFRSMESDLDTLNLSRSEAEDRVMEAVEQAYSNKDETVTLTLRPGQILAAAVGTELSPTVNTLAVTSGSVVDLTTGIAARSGSLLHAGHYYLTDKDGVVLTATAAGAVSATGIAVVLDKQTAAPADLNADLTPYADALHSLGLFAGTGSGYDLSRGATRVEGIVMLLRLLGEEPAAAAYQGTHPFKDVPAWANHYVAYAYHKGYSYGTGKATFGSNNSLSASQYLTFLLRALSYQDTNGDFSWNTAASFAVSKGMLTVEQQATLSEATFLRGHMAYCSYAALGTARKNTSSTLADYLMERGIFTAANYSAAKSSIK